MAEIEARLETLGLRLPDPVRLAPGVEFRFPWVRIHGGRAFLSGHGPLAPNGALAQPFGKVGRDLTPDQGYTAARLTALAMLASLKAALGDLDRVEAWLRVFGMVNAAASFHKFPMVMDGFSDLIIEVYGVERGRHARCAVGMAGLPFGIPVEIEAEVAIRV